MNSFNSQLVQQVLFAHLLWHFFQYYVEIYVLNFYEYGYLVC